MIFRYKETLLLVSIRTEKQ